MEASWIDRLTRSEQALFALLRCGLWEREPSATELALFPLSEAEWGEVDSLASAHTITGLVFVGICSLPEALMPSPDRLDVWVAKIDRIERSNRTMDNVVTHLLDRFHEAALHPILQKGQGVAAMYVQPLLRSCGDIDLFFPSPEEDAAAQQLVEKWGIRTTTMADGALLYRFEGIEVEHHRRLLDVYNPFCQKSIGRLLAEEGSDGHLPTPLTHLLLLNTHLLKHIIGPGVGLRQFCDMARACYVFRGRYDAERYRDYCKRWHISSWSRQLHAVLVDCLGLPADCLPVPDRVECVSQALWKKVLRGGNFGKHHGDEGTSSRGLLHKKFYTARHTLGDLRLSFSLSATETFFFVLHLILRQGK